MSVDAKRKMVDMYCGKIGCSKCVLTKKEWVHSLSPSDKYYCLSIYDADESELDEALALIHGDKSETSDEIRDIVGMDPIKPAYYNDTKITPFDVIDDWSLNFYLGNAIKYIKRAGKKADNSRLQDLKKVREYIDHEIKAEEARE